MLGKLFLEFGRFRFKGKRFLTYAINDLNSATLRLCVQSYFPEGKNIIRNCIPLECGIERRDGELQSLYIFLRKTITISILDLDSRLLNLEGLVNVYPNVYPKNLKNYNSRGATTFTHCPSERA